MAWRDPIFGSVVSALAGGEAWVLFGSSSGDGKPLVTASFCEGRLGVGGSVCEGWTSQGSHTPGA